MTSVRIVERPTLADEVLNALFSSSWDHHERRPFSAELAHSLTYLAAYHDEKLIGFVNVAWDGGLHAFLLDPTVLPAYRRQGIGAALVQAAIQAAASQGAEWLHVDYEPMLEPFYASVGFKRSRAGTLRLRGGHQGDVGPAETNAGVEYRTEIRMLGPSDHAVLSNVAPDMFDNSTDSTLVVQFLGDPRHHLAVAIDRDQVVGFASGVHYVHPDKPSEMWINEVGVAPSHQGRGLGKAIMQTLLQHAKRLDCREAWVLTDRSNHAAMRLYASVGGEEAPHDQVMFTFFLDRDDQKSSTG